MEKKKWLWSRKSSERSSGEEDHSNGSVSSQFHDQEGMGESPNGSSVSLDVATPVDDEVSETVKTLTDKLTAALVNVAAKGSLVEQHARVAEEAVAGWERAENEVVEFKQQLEAAVQQNLSLEVRVSHLEHALRECVRQLRQARDDATAEWEAKKAELEDQITHLMAENATPVDPDDIRLTIEALEMENSDLRRELISWCKEFELMTIERDLSTKAAETASKSQLDSIKRVAKLESECRRLQSLVKKFDSYDNHKSSCKTQGNGLELSLLESWTSPVNNLVASSVQIDMMDDFLEMERLAGLQESDKTTAFSSNGECDSEDDQLRAELNSMCHQLMELQEKIGKMEIEKLDIQNALDESIDSIKTAHSRLAQAEIMLEELHKELAAANKTNGLLEFQLISMEAEAREMSSKIDSLKGEIEEERNLSSELTVNMEAEAREMSTKIYTLKVEIEEERKLSSELKASMEAEARDMSSKIDSLQGPIEKERNLSSELTAKCQELEKELIRTIQENELLKSKQSDSEVKVKSEDLAVAADKLAECQKTIASLGRQLKSLATLEDFLIDTSNIPELSEGQGGGGQTCNDAFVPTCDLDRLTMAMPNTDRDWDWDSSRFLSQSASSSRSWSSFGRIFSPAKSVCDACGT